MILHNLPYLKELRRQLRQRATEEEKKYQIQMLNSLHDFHSEKSSSLLTQLQDTAIQNKNMFESLMEVTKHCSLGQITRALYEVGGQYRRNM